jgi:hypothetical protein
LIRNRYNLTDVSLNKSEARVLIIPIIFFLAIAFVIFTCLLWSHWSASNRWVQASAKVVKSYITNECATTNPSGGDTSDGGMSEGQWDQNCPRVEVPHIRYAYTVEGKKYTSERISLQGPSFGAPGEWKAWVEKRRTGKNIDIWYDPDDPDEAVIDKSWSAGADVVKVLVSGLLLAGALGAWRLARRRLA